MPSQINVQLTGRIGNLVFYKLGDKYYTRTAPSHVKQTKATKKRATEFGKASRAGKSLRQQLLPVIPFPRDNRMQTRLVSVLFQWLKASDGNPLLPCREVPYVSTFQFTEGYTVAERWKVALDFIHGPGMIEVKIPAFIPSKVISAPADTVSVTCRISAAGCNMENGVATGGANTSLDFDYGDTEIPEQTISLPLSTPAGSLFITAIFLEYNYMKNGHLQKTTNKAFMPAGVVNAVYL